MEHFPWQDLVVYAWLCPQSTFVTLPRLEPSQDFLALLTETQAISLDVSPTKGSNLIPGLATVFDNGS